MRIASAQAQASVFTKMTANLYGSTQDVEKLLASFVAGQSTASALNGFLSQAGEPTQAVLSALGKSVAQLAGSAAERLKPPAAEPRTEQAAQLEE